MIHFKIKGKSIVLSLIYFLLIALFLNGCSKRETMGIPPVPVTIAQAVVQPEPLSIDVVGTVEPIESVSIKSQVGGVIKQIGFTEGGDVQKGQLLIKVDPRPFQAALDAATAQLARDKAQAANAETQAKRYADLVKKDYVTQEQYDTVRTQAEMLKSTVRMDEANVEQAKLNLEYTNITSPISGRTGSLLVKVGNVIKANDVSLLVINQVRPIRISFSIPGSQLQLVRKYSSREKLQVIARTSRDGDGEEIRGELIFVDNAVDMNTGTVALKALFSNEDGMLWPGQFVDSKLVLTVEQNALTIPAAAVVTGQEGTFVFIVGPDKKVEKRNVKVNRVIDSTTIIDEGLKAGETVVTDGQMKLIPGAQVDIKTSLGEKRSAR